jgi:hypothetical protein
MCNIRLVKGEHVYEDNMALIHKEIAKQVKVICFTNRLRGFEPVQDLLAIGGIDGTVVVVRADAATVPG